MSTSNTIERDERGKWLTSGNPAGRPKSTGNKLPTEFKDDLRDERKRRGKSALAELTAAELVRVVASVMPRELLLDVQDQRARLSGAEWSLVVPVLRAVQAALPNAGQREPAEVQDFVVRALQAASARVIDDCTEKPPTKSPP
jgi:hypothetical protein